MPLSLHHTWQQTSCSELNTEKRARRAREPHMERRHPRRRCSSFVLHQAPMFARLQPPLHDPVVFILHLIAGGTKCAASPNSIKASVVDVELVDFVRPPREMCIPLGGGGGMGSQLLVRPNERVGSLVSVLYHR